MRTPDGVACLRRLLAVAAALTGLVVAARSEASTIHLTGSGTMSYSFQFLGSAPGPSHLANTGNDYQLDVPGQYAFLDQFLSQQTVQLATSSVGPYDFQDSYRFTIGASAQGDVMTASLGLCPNPPAQCTFQISDLQFRLYMVPTATTNPIAGGLPAGSTLITAWIGPPSGQTSVTATFGSIQAGTYILDIAGIASGGNGGTYVGQLNLAAPLPDALLLLASGLGLLLLLPRLRALRSPVG